MKIRTTPWKLLGIATFTILTSWSASAEIVTMRSGNGSLGSTDSVVNMLIGPADLGFPAAFTAADFANARSGPDAFVISPNGSWISGIAGDSLAQWIGTSSTAASEGNSALYSIDFILASPFSAAELDLHFAVDNTLGGFVNSGVYLNGVSISGGFLGGSSSETDLSFGGLAPLLHVGTNTLYLNARDNAGSAGLLFGATITTDQSVPEPTTIALFGLGLLGLAFSRRTNVQLPHRSERLV